MADSEGTKKVFVVILNVIKYVATMLLGYFGGNAIV